jgi:hypothetical protein
MARRASQRIVEKESFAGTTQYGLSVQPTGHAFVELCPTAANAFNSVRRRAWAWSHWEAKPVVATYDAQEVGFTSMASSTA